MVNRCLQDKVPEYLKEKLVKRQEVYGRDLMQTWILPYVGKPMDRDSLLFMEQTFFNSLPDDLKRVQCMLNYF